MPRARTSCGARGCSCPPSFIQPCNACSDAADPVNIFNGLIVGAFYALMALGLSLILNLSGVINFAHGGFLALGAYIAYSLMPFVGFWGALLLAPFLTAAIGLVIERLMIRRLYGRDPLYSLLLTFGLAYILEDVTRFIWGAQSLPYPIPAWLTRPLSTQFFFLTGYRLFMVLLVALAVAALFLYSSPYAPRHADQGGHAGPGDRLGAGCERARVAQFELRTGDLPGWAGRRAGGRHARAAADHRYVADHGPASWRSSLADSVACREPCSAAC